MTARPEIAVNLTWMIPGGVGGTESYITRLLRGVAELAPDDVRLRLMALPDFPRDHADLAEAFPVEVAPVRGHRRPTRVLAESTWMAWATRRAALVHHAGGTVPVVRTAPAMVTVHDVQYLDHPDWFSPVKRRYLGLMVPRAVRWARLVSTPSAAARDRLCEAFGLDPASVMVVPHGVPDLEATGPPSELRRPFFLFPAFTHPHKNHSVLLAALERLPAGERPLLVLTGGRGAAETALDAEVRRRGLTDDVVRLGYVDDARLADLFRDATGLLFPSRYEGFGVPVVEAMALGCPVAAASTTSLPEVVGDAGLLLDPDDPAAWAEAMARLAGPDRDDLVRRGRVQAGRFRQREAAGLLLDAYRRALEPT